jgi:HK97 family phage major capsid protein
MDLQEVKTLIEGQQAATVEALNKQRDEWKKHYEELKGLGAPAEEALKKVETALKRLDTVEAQIKAPVGAETSPFSTKSAGQVVAECEATQELAKQISGMGWVRGRAATIPFTKGFFAEEKTTISSSAVGNATPGILISQRVAGIVKPPQRRVRVRELMPRFTTTSNDVEFVKENAFTNAASPQVEASNKAESALTFTIDHAAVKTLAHWIPASRQILDDFAGLQAYIDQRLLDGLMDLEDAEIVSGSGTGEHLSGLITEATAYDTGLNETGDTQIDKITNAIGQLEALNMMADGIIVHPTDWRKMNKVKDQANGVGNYVLGGPGSLAPFTLWGLPVATTTALTAGTFLVGAFQRYCAIWDRMQARIDISTEHSDYFIKNMVAIRAEERLTFTQYRSDATVYGSF